MGGHDCKYETILEWPVFMSGIAWFVLTSIYLMVKRQAEVAKNVGIKTV